ncbi:hypothetical protein EQG68_10630 [Flavobacterium piscinae]|uniref:Uncharacterized protein n=1 Tax=Flavobacterium piscinae TaxID=2506424 RepID=A0A4Q1KPY0_9FLAO|nr:hypothetical protein [Flavobacterium piscinae]RXR31329.1 hypothetical protein EQG68_10630 [Flavobacterium piscinae]
MSFYDEIIKYSVSGFEKTGNTLVLNGTHKHVLKNAQDNFFGSRRPDFKFHRWAGSLKSSQALAFNIFSGVDHAEFEYDMWALDKFSNHKACVDVAIDENEIVKMYEVKMFEIVNSRGKNKIFNKPDNQKYFNLENYKWNKEIAISFISFIKDVQIQFLDKPIYGEGIKQLCCHLLGIINEMTIKDGKLLGKKVELYSLCFDYPFSKQFEMDLKNYQETLFKFSLIVDDFLAQIKMDKQIKYYGFLSLEKYINENITLIGSKNFNYVKNRYLFEKC